MKWDHINTFRRNDSGQVAVIFSLALLPLVALTSAAVDYSQLTKERNAVSSALDVAVLAAANNNAIADDLKDSYAKTHFLANFGGDIDWNLTSSVSSGRVLLKAEGVMDLTFGNIVGIDNFKISETSAATLATENTICVLALSKEDDGAISFDNDMEFLASDCAVHSNSKSARAIVAEKKLNLPTASSFCAVGGILGQIEPHSKGECSSVADPYVDVLPAPIGQCKTEFFMVSETINSLGGGTQNSISSTSGTYPDGILPVVNPLDPKDVQDILDDKFGNHTFHGESCREFDDDADDDENFTSIEKRNGNTKDSIEAISELGGDDLRKLLAAYDAYGGLLNCKDDPKPECTGFNNPFANESYEDVPSQWMVAEVFDISYGEFVPEPDAVPDIVTTGLVELVDGHLYSRNNLENELVPVSENLTGGNIQLTPGTYCGGLTVDGISVTFTSGDYIFKNGPLTFLNKSQASADRVTFGFRGAGATLNIESGSSLDIRAATDGPRKGLAFMQVVEETSPGNRAPIEGTNRISNGGKISMFGAAYFPDQTLLISGEDTHLGASSPAVGLIANKVIFRGSGGSKVAIGVYHVKAGVPPILPQVDDGVRLVD